jgi:hypothetical protein
MMAASATVARKLLASLLYRVATRRQSLMSAVYTLETGRVQRRQRLRHRPPDGRPRPAVDAIVDRRVRIEDPWTIPPAAGLFLAGHIMRMKDKGLLSEPHLSINLGHGVAVPA